MPNQNDEKLYTIKDLQGPRTFSLQAQGNFNGVHPILSRDMDLEDRRALVEISTTYGLPAVVEALISVGAELLVPYQEGKLPLTPREVSHLVKDVMSIYLFAHYLDSNWQKFKASVPAPVPLDDEPTQEEVEEALENFKSLLKEAGIQVVEF